MKPYFENELVTIYHGDCREILPRLDATVLIVDPVWPNCPEGLLQGSWRAYSLFRESIERVPNSIVRYAIHLGCNSNPRILAPIKLPFFRVTSLPYAIPSRQGRLLYSGDIAYFFGEPPKVSPGHRLIPGEAPRALSGKDSKHPCPRKTSHVSWIVDKWSQAGDIILDPFMGSGTTLVCAQSHGRKSIGIEIEEKYCEMAARRFDQRVLNLFPGEYLAPKEVCHG